ncbi:hypothetical protein J6590_032391 [Homalodisca vitripennis]|nr:hypothetical protein J6590_032391 [Homalodisca vitripennis]
MWELLPYKNSVNLGFPSQWAHQKFWERASILLTFQLKETCQVTSTSAPTRTWRTGVPRRNCVSAPSCWHHHSKRSLVSGSQRDLLHAGGQVLRLALSRRLALWSRS